MPRLLFEKTGDAVWISHLDLMRLFQRAFKRAGLSLRHTQGFNPRPSVSIALPLSVGVQSRCELLDFDLEGQAVSGEEILTRLNRTLTEGVRVLAVYDDGRKIKHLALLDCTVEMEYDRGVPEGAEEEIRALFSREALPVEKKGKNGPAQQDIIPLIHELSVERTDRNTLVLRARVCCQNPAMNPMLLCAAVGRYLPRYQPDFCKCSRLEIYDSENHIFR